STADQRLHRLTPDCGGAKLVAIGTMARRGLVSPESSRFKKFSKNKRADSNGRGVSRPWDDFVATEGLHLHDGDNLVRTWINNHDLIAHEDVVVTSPLGINNDHLLRERVQAHAGRDACPDAYRNVQINSFHLPLFDDGGNLGALFVRQLRRA